MSKQIVLCTDVVTAVEKRSSMTMDELVDVLADVHGVFEPVARSTVTETLMHGYIFECSDGTLARTGVEDDERRFLQA